MNPSLPRTTEPAPQQAGADGVRGFALAGHVTGWGFSIRNHFTLASNSALANHSAAIARHARSSRARTSANCGVWGVGFVMASILFYLPFSETARDGKPNCGVFL